MTDATVTTRCQSDKWSPRRTLAFITIASAALWAPIIWAVL